jgi:hypothetical protein
MKTTMAVVVALALVSTGAMARSGISINGRDIIRIDVEDDMGDIQVGRTLSIQDVQKENKRLRRRVHRLEQAVRQLQDRAYALESAPRITHVAPARVPRDSTCYIKTTFHGTVMGKGANEHEARANTLRACEKSDGGFDCEDGKIKCGN